MRIHPSMPHISSHFEEMGREIQDKIAEVNSAVDTLQIDVSTVSIDLFQNIITWNGPRSEHARRFEAKQLVSTALMHRLRTMKESYDSCIHKLDLLQKKSKEIEADDSLSLGSPKSDFLARILMVIPQDATVDERGQIICTINALCLSLRDAASEKRLLLERSWENLADSKQTFLNYYGLIEATLRNFPEERGDFQQLYPKEWRFECSEFCSEMELCLVSAVDSVVSGIAESACAITECVSQYMLCCPFFTRPNPINHSNTDMLEI